MRRLGSVICIFICSLCITLHAQETPHPIDTVAPPSCFPNSDSSGYGGLYGTFGGYTYPGNYPSGVLVNWVRSTTLRAPVTDTGAISTLSNRNKAIATVFSDGLGRTIQSVSQQFTENDIVALAVYDSFGRQPASLLPYNTNTNYGNFKRTAFSDQAVHYASAYPDDGYPYNMTQFDDATLYRSVIQMKPGTSYVGNGVGKTQMQLVNSISEGVRVWDYDPAQAFPISDSIWGNSTLFVNETLDEAGISTRQYIDKEGRLVLKKVQLSGSPGIDHTGWLCTYYVYDSLSHLRCVIPPLAVDYLAANSWTFTTGDSIYNELCYGYTYDYLGRAITKKLPGRSPISIIYDSTYRSALVQDGNLAGTNQWMFVKYDVLGRVILTGKYLNPSLYSAATLRNLLLGAPSDPLLSLLQLPVIQNTYDTTTTIPGAEIYTINYYDNYSKIPSYFGYSPSAEALLPTGANAVTETLTKETSGMPIGGYVRIMNGMSVTSAWLSSVKYYDLKGKVIQTQSRNFNKGIDTASMLYDFSGSVLSSYTSQYNPLALDSTQVPWVHIMKSFGYTGNKQLQATYQEINTDPFFRQLNYFYYDSLGRVNKKQFGSIESQTYTYRIWGDLESINKGFCASGGTGNYYGEILSYDFGYGGTAQDGLPSGLQWRLKGSNTIERSYGYTYDNALRLTEACYSQSTDGVHWSCGSENYSSTHVYDDNGNLIAMTQNGTEAGYSAPFLMDSLTYRYNNGGFSNKLKAVDDAITINYHLGEFYEEAGTTPVDYNYDNNGNTTTDANKNITSIAYNYSNKPDTILFTSGRSITFAYSANGTLLRKQIIEPTFPTKTIDYLGGLEYDNNSLIYSSDEEGRTRPVIVVGTLSDTSEVFEYDYFIKDHMGNVRSTVTENVTTNLFSGTVTPDIGGIAWTGVNPISPYPLPVSGLTFSTFTLVERDYLATNEICNAALERSIFSNIDSFRDNKPLTTDSSDTKDARLNASESRFIGPSLVLRVMAGDSISLSSDAYYSSATMNDSNGATPSQLANALLSGLSSGVGFNTFIEGGTDISAGYTQLQDNLISLMGSEYFPPGVDATQPQAFLNYVLMDDNMNIVSSGFVQLTAANADAWSTLSIDKFPVNISGYFIAYVSNSSPMDVGFDNIMVRDFTGNLTTENHYYPYGLTITKNAILAAPKTNYLYQSQELNHAEFSDGTGLDWCNFNARFYDPQIGRWHVSDPLAEQQSDFSPYHYCYGNPVICTDPSGLKPIPMLPMNSQLRALDGNGFFGGGCNFGDPVESDAIDWFSNVTNYGFGMNNTTFTNGVSFESGFYWKSGQIITQSEAVGQLQNSTYGGVSNISSVSNSDAWGAIINNAFSNNIGTQSVEEMNNRFDAGLIADGQKWVSDMGCENIYDQGTNSVYWYSTIYNGSDNDFLSSWGAVTPQQMNNLVSGWWGDKFIAEANQQFYQQSKSRKCDGMFLPFSSDLGALKFVFGLEDYINEFKALEENKNFVDLMEDGDWRNTFLHIISNPNSEIHFLLDGIDETPMNMILNPSRGCTNWELSNLYQNTGAFENTTFYYGGNTFQGYDIFANVKP